MALGFIDFVSFFDYSSSFILGILLFLKKTNRSNNQTFYSLSLITIILGFIETSPTEVIFSLITYLIILSNVNLDFRITNYLGKISYSLYITHWTIGLMAEIVIKRLIGIHQYPSGKIIMLLLYTVISIIFASIFYNSIEKPFINLSKKVILNREKIKN